VSTRPFRVGVALRHAGGGHEWLAKAKLAEDLGYDVLLAADNPMVQAPFQGLAAAAVEHPTLALRRQPGAPAPGDAGA
jgi:alkanesulfonate monooxygenase SsuD/methylene tetrahydromethanopterin reductase-like flavin-dependent oxidoreductase (luciferase family)